jgi:hypothetical protein
MLGILQYDETFGGARISKRITLEPSKSTRYFKHYIYSHDNLNFNYYDLSEIYIGELNYREQVGTLVSRIFKMDIEFSDILFDESYIFNKADYEIFYELGIFNIDTVAFTDIEEFYKINNSVCNYIFRNKNNSELIDRFNQFLLKLKINEIDMHIIKQLVGLEEKINENKLIIDIISDIYKEYEFIYICIAPGNDNKLPNYFTEGIINNKKSAIIYIAESSSSFPPFWIKNNSSGWEVTEQNFDNAFIETNTVLKKTLDVFIFDYRIPFYEKYFFDRLSTIINKKTLLYVGFSGCGHMSSVFAFPLIITILNNSNVIPYSCVEMPNIGFFKDTHNLYENLVFNNYPIELIKIIIDFCIGEPDVEFKTKYIKYKTKYIKLKKYMA